MTSAVGTWWACGKPDEPLDPSLATVPAGCNVTMTYLGNKILTAAPNSINNNASWFVNNNGTTAVTLNGQTLTKSGAVTAVKTNVWASFPYSLPAGSRIDSDLRFDVGASGTGTVGMTVSSSCGSIVAPAHTVNIQAATAGIPYGLYSLIPTTVPSGALWTGGALFSRDLNNIANQLAAAQNHTPRMHMWFNMTSGNEQNFYKSATDHSFSLTAWKDSLRAHAGPYRTDGTSPFNATFQPYITNGTFAGHSLLDDIANFSTLTQADIEGMAAESKLRFPGLLTAVRGRATQLKTAAAACSTCTGGKKPYAVLDVAWAQYVSRSDTRSAAAYRDAEIAAAQDMKLGLVIGINMQAALAVGGTTSPAPVDSVLSWGSVFLAPGASDYVCFYNSYNADYPNLSDPVFTTLANKAKSHVAAPCKRR